MLCVNRHAATKGMLLEDQRRPQWIYGVGEEPDHRYSLANERTFLAWIRTALGLIGAGVAVEAFGVASPAVRAVLAALLVALGGVSGAAASLRWARIERALRQSSPMPAAGLIWVTSAAVLVVAVLVLIVI